MLLSDKVWMLNIQIIIWWAVTFLYYLHIRSWIITSSLAQSKCSALLQCYRGSAGRNWEIQKLRLSYRLSLGLPFLWKGIVCLLSGSAYSICSIFSNIWGQPCVGTMDKKPALFHLLLFTFNKQMTKLLCAECFSCWPTTHDECSLTGHYLILGKCYDKKSLTLSIMNIPWRYPKW